MARKAPEGIAAWQNPRRTSSAMYTPPSFVNQIDHRLREAQRTGNNAVRGKRCHRTTRQQTDAVATHVLNLMEICSHIHVPNVNFQPEMYQGKESCA